MSSARRGVPRVAALEQPALRSRWARWLLGLDHSDASTAAQFELIDAGGHQPEPSGRW
ncbi:hypothetical protein HYG77_21940 [Rhodococcus sp. ZPP]|uniref:hypothetical protein n=1 Tax=Rhodococcus sp. ZPP TaxID=2749906 RepID=UPI001AD8877D|nr:hypothetical protein [Rhodococcus sp. ZPP]QTJ67981.1 hypothetical protein HYG77_21940 [Rhodococcus sp. ZPP]